MPGEADRTPTQSRLRLAYLASRYPAVSHSFVQREVESLRTRGVEIHTLAIHGSSPGELLTEADRRAARTTYWVLPPRWRSLVASHLTALLSRPDRYLSTLRLALRLPRGGRGRLGQLFHFAEAVPVWRECHRRGIRHLHAHFTSPPADVALLVASLGGGAGAGWSWSFTAHGTDISNDVPARLAEKIRRASLVLCVSQFGRRQLMALVEEAERAKIRLVRLGVDGSRFCPPERAAPNGGPLQLLAVGRLAPEKGHEFLLEAVAELARRGVPAHLRIVGEGSARPALESRAAELGVTSTVELAGAVGHDRIRDYYAAADVFCLPSVGEGLPVVLMEAMAMGLPVVASQITGVPELVEDGVTGVLVRPTRSSELADSIERLATDPALRRRMGREGRGKVLAEFDLSLSADRLHDAFSRLLGRRADRARR